MQDLSPNAKIVLGIAMMVAWLACFAVAAAITFVW